MYVHRWIQHYLKGGDPKKKMLLGRGGGAEWKCFRIIIIEVNVNDCWPKFSKLWFFALWI